MSFLRKQESRNYNYFWIPPPQADGDDKRGIHMRCPYRAPINMDSRKNAANDAIRLDAEGNWYQGYYPILHDRTCKYLHKSIEIDEKGQYYLAGEEKPIYIQVEDVPYWITKVERTIAGFLITLTDETIELLDPTTLWSKKKEALYCLVKGGKFSCKFQRPPYYEITKELEQRGEKFYLVIGGKNYPIAKEPPAVFLKAQAAAVKARKVSAEKQKKKKKKGVKSKKSGKSSPKITKKAAKKKK